MFFSCFTFFSIIFYYWIYFPLLHRRTLLLSLLSMVVVSCFWIVERILTFLLDSKWGRYVLRSGRKAHSPLFPGSKTPQHNTATCLSTTFYFPLSCPVTCLSRIHGPTAWRIHLTSASTHESLDSPPSHTPRNPLTYMGLCVPHLPP